MPISMCIGTIDLSSVSENEVIKVNARRINWSVKLDLLRECDQTYGSRQLTVYTELSSSRELSKLPQQDQTVLGQIRQTCFWNSSPIVVAFNSYTHVINLF